MPDTPLPPGGPPRFAATQWSVIVAASDGSSTVSGAALELLCRTYWYPLYAYVRRAGHAPPEAQDLTQAFFARMLEKDWIKVANPARGRFRTFLLVALNRFLAKEWRHAAARKRGGHATFIALDATEAEQRFAVEPALGPDEIFEHRWAMTLLHNAMERLASEYAATKRTAEFECLKQWLTAARGEIPYETVAAQIELSPGAARVAVHRLRKRFREMLRLEVAETVDSPTALEDELRHLAVILSRRP